MNNDQTKKTITGLLIGLVGVGALYCIYAAKQQKIPLLQKIGKTIAEVGEMIESSTPNKVHSIAETIEEKLPKGTEILNNVSEWISTGISLWKKLSK